MNTYFLHTDAYPCELDDGVVFLDLKRQTYLAVESSDVTALQSRVQGWQDQFRTIDAAGATLNQVDATLARLVDIGLLTTSAGCGKAAAKTQILTTGAIALPTRAMLMSSPPLSFDLPRLMSSFLYVSASLHMRPLKILLSRLAGRKATNLRSDLPQTALHEVVHSFLRLRCLLYTARNNCLLDSLTLTHLLLKRRFAPTFVMGVTTKPFSAHAWVQSGDQVVNDSLERIQAFTPIFSL